MCVCVWLYFLKVCVCVHAFLFSRCVCVALFSQSVCVCVPFCFQGVSARMHAGVLYTLTPLLRTALRSQPLNYSHGYQILMSVCPVGISLWSKAPTKGERKSVTKANGPLVNYGRGRDRK